MINYLNSEWYRLRKNPIIPILLVITGFLVVLADLILMLFNYIDDNFLYGHTLFYYSNALSMSIVVYLVGYLIASVLLGKDKEIMKVSVSSGIKRETIFFGKLLLSIATFLVIGVLLTILMVVMGESTLDSTHNNVINDLFISMINLLPIMLSAFILSFVFNLFNVKDANGIVIILAIYFFAGAMFRYVQHKHAIFKFLYTYSPNGMLEKNLILFMNSESQIMIENWIFAIVVSFIAITISYFRFKKVDL